LSGFAVEGIGLDFEWAAIRLFFQTSREAFFVLTTGASSTASFIGRRM
jgi:hypothetical protein